MAEYGTGALSVLLDHFDVQRGGEVFIYAAEAKAEWLRFKCSEYFKRRNLSSEVRFYASLVFVAQPLKYIPHASLQDLLKTAVTTLKGTYPNFILLYEVILVLCLSNAPPESGFSHMKVVKRCNQANMETSTIDTKLMLRLHGPPEGSDKSLEVVKYSVSMFFKAKSRMPNRRTDIAAPQSRITSRGVKRRTDAVNTETETKKLNTAIASTVRRRAHCLRSIALDTRSFRCPVIS